MRVISSNALKRAATFTALTTAGAMALSNVLTNDKTETYQSIGPTAQLTVRWNTPERTSAFVLPICDLSPTAQMRVRISEEVAAVNQMTNSHLASTWSSASTTKTNNEAGVFGPDGVTLASSIKFDATTGSHYVDRTIAPLSGNYVNGVRYTSSLFVKALGLTTCKLQNFYAAGGASGKSATFTLTGSGAVSANTCESATITAYPNGWYRISITNVTDVAVTNPAQLLVRLMLGTAPGSFDTATGLYIWGAMFTGGALTSFYPSGATAATRPAGYMDTWQTYSYDSGYVNCSEAEQIILDGWSAAQSATAYTYGGGTCAQMWFPEFQATGMIADISDPSNALGAINIAQAIAGPYWETAYHASSVTHRTVDTSVVKRTNADTQTGQAGNIHKVLPIKLSMMPAKDRKQFVKLVRTSKINPIFISVYPGHADKDLERDLSIYGRRSDDSDIELEFAEAYSTDLTVEEV